MGILTELMEKIEKSELDEQMRQICDEIMKEEMPRIENLSYMPKGPNIFLAISCNSKKNPSVNFLCLERESKEKYIVSLWSKLKNSPESAYTMKRKTVWEVTDGKTEKILKFYAEKLKFVKGE